jgi:hypothetical protein
MYLPAFPVERMDRESKRRIAGVMMHMSKLRAINLCKLMWERIHISGMNKEEWLKMHPECKFGYYGCPLCCWVEQGESKMHGGQKVDGRIWCRDSKRICPLIQQYGKSCLQLGYRERLVGGAIPTAEWYKAVRELK